MQPINRMLSANAMPSKALNLVNNIIPDTSAPPVDPKVQSILDTKRPDGKSVKEKLDADAPAYLFKATQDHYNKQKENSETLDNVSKFYLNNAAKNLATNGDSNEKVAPEKLAGVFNTVQIDKNLEEITKDPGFVKWTVEQQANAVEGTIRNNPDIAKLVAPYLQEGENHVNALRRMQSDYLVSQAFADGAARGNKEVITEGLKTLSSFGLGEKEMRGVANTLAENIRGKYTPDAPRPVIDPNTNKPIQTEDGNDLAILPDGTNIALDAQGKPVADKEGNAYVYYQDGTYKLDAGRRFIQYDARAGASFATYGSTKYLIGPDRNGRYDAQGRPLVLDSGAPVALGADGKAVADAAGNKLVFDPATGKAVTDPASGNAVVIDPATKGIVQIDAGGKVVSAANGDPYAVDQKTGKFMQDAQGRYVQISKDNIAPGILPGYVTDARIGKMVVSTSAGKPMVDPALGKTVILDPRTNAPQLVPLDATGVPKQSSDGKSIVYNETGTTVVPGEGRQPDWLVNQDGSYVQNAAGNYIGVDRKTGLAAPVDEKGFIRDGNGLAPLWDIGTNAPMKTTDGMQIAITDRGAMLMLTEQGQFVFEEKSGLPYVIDPKTRSSVTNPETGRSILLSNGTLVEYNADDGYQYLIHPKTRTTVKTTDGIAVVMSGSAGVPYAVKQDGSAVKNPYTGNTVVYGTNGQPVKETSTGNYLEITADGKVHVIDPKTNAPMAELNPQTGGYLLFDQAGNPLVDPVTGNKIEIDALTGLKVQIDTSTGQPAKDANGNILVTGATNQPLKTPDGKSVVIDKQTGLPVAVGTDGKVGADPGSGLPRVINTQTGVPLADPLTKVSVVADPKSGAPVQVDTATGKIIQDPATLFPVIASAKTGSQIKSAAGEPVVVTPAGVPVYLDKATNTLKVADPLTGKTVTNPVTGAWTILEPNSGIPLQVIPDAKGNLVVVDSSGTPIPGPGNNPFYIDRATGEVVFQDKNGDYVSAYDGKKPEAFDPGAWLPPSVFGMARAAGTNPPDVPGIPLNGAALPEVLPTDIPAEYFPGVPWKRQSFTLSPEALAAAVAEFKRNHPNVKFDGLTAQAEGRKATILEEAKASGDPARIKAAEAYQAIPAEELAVIEWYTLDASINHVLASGDPGMITRYTGEIEIMSSALNHMEAAGFRYEGRVFRYIEVPTEAITAQHPLNKYMRMPRFTSTSQLENFGWYGNIKYKMNNVTGVDISGISPVPGEVLLRPDGLHRTDEIGPWLDPHRQDPRLDPAVYSPTELTLTSSPDTPVPVDGQPGTSSSAAPLPIDEATTNDTTTVPLDETAKASAGKWAKLGSTLSRVLNGLDIAGGGAQVVLGGLQIADGVRHNDKYDIASGSLNTISGGLAISAGTAGVVGGAAAAAAVPLAAAAAFVGMISLIVDILKHQDDHKKFADTLGGMFGSLGILNDGWHDKAAQVYYESQGEPDPAPIAHGNLP